MTTRRTMVSLLVALAVAVPAARAQKLDIQEVEGQVLGANAARLLDALAFVGAPLPRGDAAAIKAGADARDAKKLQELLDPHVLAQVTVNPEARVKAARGPAADRTKLQQNGYVAVVLKVVNEGGVKSKLNVASPQAGPVYAGGAAGNRPGDKARFLDVEVYRKQPMTESLSSARVEYVLALLYSSEAGKREVTLGFDVGQGTQDLGFRGELPILFDVRPAVPVKVVVRDVDGTPTTGRFTFTDNAGHVYPSKAKRLAPDFFFQDQVYRHSGGTVLLPPGELTVSYGRGPEYRMIAKKIRIDEKEPTTLEVTLDRWIDPMKYGFYSGDHHIHAAGCAHYTSPTEGVHSGDMFLHVKGEGLNVGCNLTWGPCYDYQRQYFEPHVNKISEPLTLIKYDVEVSGFGSQLLGHVCLLNLRDQTYPGSDGTKVKGWPTWTTPLMRWAKSQGAVTGYAHSANGLVINDVNGTARRILGDLDTNNDGAITKDEAAKGLLPDTFDAIDTDKDGTLNVNELTASVNRKRNVLPNLIVPPMDGIGAQEICVTAAQGLCDFISAMDTARVPEWNCWYHIMNCGLPLKASGETDFPCINGSRVGMGRVYVQLGKVEKIDFTEWCEGLRKGRSYISDGYAHALEFTVDGKTAGHDVALAAAGNVAVKAKVAFARDLPLGTADGAPRPYQPGRTRKVELVVNGVAVAAKEVPADDKPHDLTFEVPIAKSSWVALRHFPQMHTNPVNVVVGGKPIRASKESALWCLGTIDQLWRVRARNIDEKERGEAQATFERAKEFYRKIAAEAP